jgi:hypothetical protein
MKTIIITILSAIIITLFTTWYNAEKPELYYIISDWLPLEDFSTNKNEKIQQIQIINKGNKSATNIIFKIEKAINDYKVKPFSINDIYKDSLTSAGVEVSYEKLSPDSYFTVIIKAPIAVDASNLFINSDSGKAQNFLNKSDFWLISILYFFWAALIFVFFYSAYKLLKDEYIDKAKTSFTYASKILARNKPIIFSKKYWNKLLFFAAETSIYDFSKNTFFDITKTDAYLILNDQVKIPDENAARSKLLEQAEEALKLYIQYDITNAYNLNSLEKMLFEKPKLISEKAWGTIRAKIVDAHSFIIFSNFRDFTSALNKLNSDVLSRPTKLTPREAIEIQSSFDKAAYIALIDEIVDAYKPLNTFEKYKSTISNKALTDKLHKLASRISIFSKMDDVNFWHSKSYFNDDIFDSLTDEDKNILRNAHTKILKSEEIITALRKISSFAPELKRDEYSNLDEEEFNFLISIRDVYRNRDEINKKLIELSGKEIDINFIRNKIIQQLTFIDDFLKDPHCIDKIEEYDTTFSKGNLENLQKLATIISQQNSDN